MSFKRLVQRNLYEHRHGYRSLSHKYGGDKQDKREALMQEADTKKQGLLTKIKEHRRLLKDKRKDAKETLKQRVKR